MKGNTNLIGRKCLAVYKPVKDIALIVGLLGDKPVTLTKLAHTIDLSILYTKDLVDVLVEIGAVSVKSGPGGGVTLNPMPIPLGRVVELIEDRPYNLLPRDFNYGDLIESEIRDAIGNIDISKFSSALNLHKPGTDYLK